MILYRDRHWFIAIMILLGVFIGLGTATIIVVTSQYERTEP